MRKALLFLIVAIFFSLATVQAQEDSPKIPSKWSLFWQNFNEKVSLAITVNTEKRAEKALVFSEKRMQMAEAFALKAKENPELEKKVQQMMEHSDKFMTMAIKNQEKIKENTDQRKEKLIERTAQQIMKKEEVLNSLEEKIAPERMEMIQTMRQDNLEKSQNFLNSLPINEISLDIQERVQNMELKSRERLIENQNFIKENNLLIEQANEGNIEARQEIQNKQNNRVQEQIKVKTNQAESLKKNIK